MGPKPIVSAGRKLNHPVPAHCLRLEDSRYRLSIDASVDNAGDSQPHLLYHIHFMAAISLLHGRLLAMHHNKIPFTLATCLIHDNESSGDY